MQHAFKPYSKCVGCMECTGVLITPRIVLSAAHCTMYIKVTTQHTQPHPTFSTLLRKSTDDLRMINAYVRHGEEGPTPIIGSI